MTWDRNDYGAAAFLLAIVLISFMIAYFLLAGGSGGIMRFIPP